jgi:hypothetical protein
MLTGVPARVRPGVRLAAGWVSVSPEFEAAIDVPAPKIAPATPRTPSAPCSASPSRHEHVCGPRR